MKTALLDAYRFFRAAGCGVREVHDNAKTERRAKETGIVIGWQDEDESYEDVYGEPKPEYCIGPFYAYAGISSDEDGEDEWCQRHGNQKHHKTPWGLTCNACAPSRTLASLGMVTLASWQDPYRRVVEAELASEALDTLDAERDAIATLGANELASRATFAGPGVKS